MNEKVATLIGMTSILLWASMVGLVKQVSLLFGASFGVALVYTVSAVILMLIFRLPQFDRVSWRFLGVSSVLFVAYELCFSFAIAYSQSGVQAIEVSILNYLWPCLTILALVLARELRFNVWVVVGLGVCLYGVIDIQMGGSFDVWRFINNAKQNPISYILATVGAVIWAVYCVIIKKMSGGQNLIAVYFVLTALAMWVKFWLLGDGMPSQMDAVAMGYLLLAGAAIGLGYGAWNFGILKGRAVPMVIASYFTPVLSSVMASILLGADLQPSFWSGVLLVSVGSLVCYLATSDVIAARFNTKQIK